ncbi:glycosyltransferase family 2 protein [Paenibacillus tritici]|uniref:glycosyltransferase family 2 protein n=1 Tax=Paenibacillus tritici TaxID=1873425 RepID=UPI001FE3D19A|nr:glycosyltransferase family 2 protein [Paenibacillus tritici]
MNSKRIRVLLGSPIHQKPAILEQFLNSLLRLNLGHIDLDYYLIDDNQDEASSELLQQFASQSGRSVFLQASGYRDDYIRDENTHVWHSSLVWKVAGFKNLMIRRAEAFGYDYLFLIDSDLILHPGTLLHLISTGKDIISEIFWTKWQPNTLMQPQVWMHDEYNQWEVLPGEQLSPEEIRRRFYAFLLRMQQPGVYEVGGLGACTLISSRAIGSGVSYDRVPNISYWGEDRHFCIRAAALGLPLFVDTHFPALHLYRDSDLDLVAEFIRLTSDAETAIAEEESADDSEAPGGQAGAEPAGAHGAAGADLTGDAEAAPADKRVQEAGAEWEALWTQAEARRRLSKEPDGDDDTGGAALEAAEADRAEKPDPAAGGDGSGEAASERLQAAPREVAAPAVAPAIALAAAAPRPKLTLTMIVKNEGSRFLRQVLLEHRKYIDEAVIIDDGSTDDTADICREVLQGIPLHLICNPVSKFHHESELRKQQWDAVVATRPEWILNLDADEMFEDRFPEEVDSLLRTDNCELFCFRLYDFWSETHYREDLYWRAHFSYRPFLLRYRENFNYLWNNLPQHCGRLPENIFELRHQLSNLRLKHLGWSKPEYREQKYLRYMQLDPNGQYGWKEQYESILDPQPYLVPWKE